MWISIPSHCNLLYLNSAHFKQGQESLEPQLKQISLFWKCRGTFGLGGGVGASVGLENGNSTKNV